MKENVSSVDHVWGDIGEKYFSGILIEKKLAIDIQLDVDKTTKEIINNLLLRFNKRIDSFNFYENNIR